ncbi:uncharacterized protein LOC133513351 isoform X3 [Syngnathoides biaculeatus]|uniref:uncharacterized protein LOC133513351 isoform X3 n=1 Tax=Syngnathoides biaculeatus TaxID=300417 RepID=UPI002ADDD8A9|nr:uncharacterized protein LOC133513351 isoform X3 [Syngnathoides biaculeatus]
MGWGAPPGRTSSSCHEPAPTRISEPRSVTLWRRRRDVTGFTTRPLASPSRRRSGGFHGDHGCQSGGGPDASQLTDPRNSSLARAAGFWIPEGGHYSSKSICMYGWLLPLTAKTPARRGQAQRFYKANSMQFCGHVKLVQWNPFNICVDDSLLDRLGSRDGGAEDERGAIYPRRIRRCVTEVWTVAAGPPLSAAISQMGRRRSSEGSAEAQTGRSVAWVSSCCSSPRSSPRSSTLGRIWSSADR